MDTFIYKQAAGITALSAKMTDFSYKMHSHKEYAIGVTLHGIQEYKLGGSVQLSHRNGIMLFNPEQAHDGMAHDAQGLEYVMLYIDPEMLREASGKKELVRFTEPVVYDAALGDKILRLSDAIQRDKGDALCNEMLLSLTDSLTQTNETKHIKTDDARIRTAKEMLRANPEQLLKLDDICSELQLSKFQFIRMFKAQTGITPYQYFLNCKMEQARRVIEMKRDVYAAVVECGFVDLTHLNKHFKSVYGITAYEYLTHLNR